MHAYYASATVLANSWPVREPVLKGGQYLRNGKQNCTLTFACTYVHRHTCGYLETDTYFTNICSFPFLQIMDIAKPLGCMPFSPFSVIPWYLQIVNIQIYLNK